jgi:hypothetical protein
MSDAKLPYELTFEERPGYLYACITATDINKQTALDYLQKVTDRVIASGYEAVMVERDIPAMLPSADLFFTAQDFLKMIGPTQVAFVNKYATIHQAMEFAMLIGTNRGANYRLFHDVSAAEQWLIGSITGLTP